MKHVLSNVLFLDIETVSATSRLEELDERLQKNWIKKAAFLHREETVDAARIYQEKAAIFAEYGRIVVIGLGFFTQDGDRLSLRLKALYDRDENKLLKDFNRILSRMKSDELQLCAHNGKEFDFPYLCRRLLINRLPMPEVLRISGKKPWEIRHLDTMEMWKFGEYKHYTSLDLLANVFEIPSSKRDMDGSLVGKVYYEENNLDKIADYCLDDVQVTARLFLRMTGRYPEDIQVEITPSNTI